MAFGTLTIRLESGEIRDHKLENPTTSVGRQPGNDIVLSTTSVSRYHAQFAVAEGQVFLVDLGTVNGTFVNDQQIEPNSRVPLAAGDEIIMGDVCLIFQPPEGQVERTRPGVVLEPELGTVRQEGVPFQIILDRPQQSVSPGARLQLELIVENLSDQPEVCTVELGGMNREWVKANRRDVRLDPYEQTEVTISVRPPRSSQTTPGLYPLTVTVKLKEHPEVHLQATREIGVVGYAGLAVIVRERKQPGSYHVAVQNQGNVPVSVQLGGFHPQKLLRYKFEPSHMTLGPGATEQVRLRVLPRGIRLMGAPETTEFAVVARSLDAAGYQAPVTASYTIIPSWTTLLTPLIGLGALVVIAIMAILVGILLARHPSAPPPETSSAMTTLLPTPTLVTLPTQDALAPLPDILVIAEPNVIGFRLRGEPIALRWQFPVEFQGEVTTQVFQVSPDGSLRAAITDAETGRREAIIPREGLLPGEYLFELEVVSPSGAVQKEAITVTVEIPLCGLVGKDIPFFYLPNDAALYEVPPSLGTEQRVIILGRDETELWLQLILGTVYDPLAQAYWVRAEDVDCEEGIEWEDFVIAPEGAAPTDTPSPQEAPPTQNPQDDVGG